MSNGGQKSASDPEGPASRTRYVVLLGLCLAAAIAYLPRNSIAVAESTIRRELDISKQAMSWVMAGFFITYAVFQLPTGWLCTIWGSRRALPVFAALWSLGAALMGLAYGWPGLLLNRLGQGAAQAGVFPGATAAVARWFPLSQRSLASGALGSSMSIGGVIGSALTGVLLLGIGWRWMFVVYAVPGLLWAAWFYMWFRNRPEDHPSVNVAELALIRRGADETASPAEGPAEAIPWAALFSSPAVWWMCGQQFFRAAGYNFFATWFATYLQQGRGVTIENSGLLNSLPLLAVVGGGVAGGALSDWVQVRTGSRRLSRKGLSVASLIACALLVLLAFFLENVVWAVAVISLGSFLAGAAGAAAYTITIDMGGRHVPTVFSTMNMAGNIGGVAFPLAVPWLVDHGGGWDAVLLVFAGIYVGAALCWTFLKPEGTVFDQSLIRAPRS